MSRHPFTSLHSIPYRSPEHSILPLHWYINQDIYHHPPSDSYSTHRYITTITRHAWLPNPSTEIVSFHLHPIYAFTAHVLLLHPTYLRMQQEEFDTLLNHFESRSADGADIDELDGYASFNLTMDDLPSTPRGVALGHVVVATPRPTILNATPTSAPDSHTNPTPPHPRRSPINRSTSAPTSTGALWGQCCRECVGLLHARPRRVWSHWTTSQTYSATSPSTHPQWPRAVARSPQRRKRHILVPPTRCLARRRSTNINVLITAGTVCLL